MKTTFILLIAHLLAVSAAFGQGNVLCGEIQAAKKARTVFETVSVLQATGMDKRVSDTFINPDEVSFFEYTPAPTGAKAIRLILPGKREDTVLELLEVPESFYDYEVQTSDGRNYPANRAIKHYRGIVSGDNNSLAALTIYENELMGIFATDAGNFNITKDPQSGKHLLFNDKNRKKKLDFECATKEDNSFSYDPEVLLRPRADWNEETNAAQFPPPLNKKVRFFVETQYPIYQAKGESVSAVEGAVTSLFNQAYALYANESITTGISTIYVWTEPDPYTATTVGLMLALFQEKRPKIYGDLGILLAPGYNANDMGGVAAGFEGLCNPHTYKKLAVVKVHNDYNPYPVYSYSVFVITHELGHLLGSHHTNDCVWGMNHDSAIDACADVCGCPSPVPPYPPEGGTIMSYCNLDGRPGVNFNLGFGIQPGNVIRNSVTNASCVPCRDTLNYNNQVVTTNTEESTCGTIYASGISVTNGAKLTLTATDATRITGSFSVAPGSRLEIKSQ
jgi:hypothetical protein